MPDIWEDEFIPSDIMDNIVYTNANQYKCEGYITDLNDATFESDLDATIAGIDIKEDYITSGHVYSDIDD